MRNPSVIWFKICLLLAMVAPAICAAPTAAAPFRQETDPLTRGDALFEAGLQALNASKLEDALEYFEVALPLYQEASDREREALCLLHIGLAREVLADYSGAVDAYNASLPMWQDLGRGAEQAMALSHMGIAYRRLGQYDRALQNYEQALAIVQEIADQKGEASILDNMGVVLNYLGRCAEALEHHERAQAIHHSAGNLPGEANSLMNLGAANRCLGEYNDALANLHQALEILRESGDNKSEAETLGNIGLTYDRQGRYEQALDAFHRALVIFQDLADAGSTGITLANLGLVHRHLGQHQQAVAYYKQALDIFQEMGNQQALASTLHNLGTVYGAAGQAGPALETLQRASELYRAGGYRAGEMAALNNTGAVHYDLGQYQEARDAFLGALDIARETGSRAGEAGALNSVGLMYVQMGQGDEALDNLAQALAIRRDLGDLAGQSRTLQNIGWAYEMQGDGLQAIDWYEQSVVALESILGEMRVEEFKASLAGERTSVYASLIHVLAAEGRSGLAFDYAERARARAFLDQVGNQQVDYRQDAAPALVEEEMELRQQIAALQYRLDEEGAKTYDRQSQDRLAALARDLEQARDDYRQLLTRLKLESPEHASLVSVSTLSLEEVQEEVLDEQTTLIEYFVLDDQTLAWIVDQDGFEVVTLQTGRDYLRDQVEFLRNLVEVQEFDAQVVAGLYEALFAPLKPQIQHPNLVIVPHGVLHYLPFAALWNEEEARFLLEDYAITYAPSASVLKYIVDKRNPDEGQLLALGNPDGSLPHSEAEAKGIAKLYGATPLLGAEATESQVFAQGGEVDLLHLAAHGLYDPYDALYSRIELAPDETQDGNLEVHEVFGLDLTGANLVVLSACRTALGEQSEGDELVGLTRAFLYAGTPAVVTTLWPIDDAASGALMEAFYGHLREGLTNAEALRAAQMEVMAQEGWEEPYYWAAFTLTGDYRGSGEPRLGIGGMPEAAAAPAAALTVEETLPTSVPTAEPSPTAQSGGGGFCPFVALPPGLVLLLVAGRLRVHRRTNSFFRVSE